jgi:hypothetical protein
MIVNGQQSSLGVKMLNAVRSFPFEIYSNRYLDLFIEIFKLAVETDDQHLSTAIIAQVIDAFVNQANNNSRLGPASLHLGVDSVDTSLLRTTKAFLKNTYRQWQVIERTMIICSKKS